MNNKEPLYYIITKIHNSNINSRSFLGRKWMFYQLDLQHRDRRDVDRL